MFDNAVNLINCYLLRILINEQNDESTVFEKTKQCISFKLGDFQPLHKMIFLGAATSFDSFMKAYKTQIPKILYRENGSTAPTNCKLQSVPTTMRFTVNFITEVILKQNWKTWLSYL